MMLREVIRELRRAVYLVIGIESALNLAEYALTGSPWPLVVGTSGAVLLGSTLLLREIGMDRAARVLERLLLPMIPLMDMLQVYFRRELPQPGWPEALRMCSTVEAGAAFGMSLAVTYLEQKMERREQHRG